MITLDAELAVMQSFKSQEADWFEEWFGDDYLRIYQHRDESEAERAIELIAARVLACLRTVMKRGGMLVIDFLNAGQVRRNLVPYDQRVENGITIEQSRIISPDNRFVEKTIWLRERGREYVERVRLLSAGDLERMLEVAGFEVAHCFGDYAGGSWSENAPRTILFASRK